MQCLKGYPLITLPDGTEVGVITIVDLAGGRYCPSKDEDYRKCLKIYEGLLRRGKVMFLAEKPQMGRPTSLHLDFDIKQDLKDNPTMQRLYTHQEVQLLVLEIQKLLNEFMRDSASREEIVQASKCIVLEK